MPFTAAELAEMAAADAEIEATFCMERDDLERSRALDREAHFDALPPEKRLEAEKRRARYEAKREVLNAQSRKYKAKNPEKMAASRKAYRETNREKIAAQKRAWYQANRERANANHAAWCKANREKLNAYQRERRRRLKDERNQAEKEGAMMDILRKMDKLGRVVVPKSLRDQLDWKLGDSIEVSIQEDGIFLRKHEVYPILERVRRLRKIAIQQKASIVVLEHLDRILEYLGDEP